MKNNNWHKFLEFVMGVDPSVFKDIKKTKLNLTKKAKTKDEKLNELLAQEAEIGGAIFGAAQADEDRKFYCLDERTWVYQNTYRDLADGKEKTMVIRYELHPNGVMKIVNSKNHSMVDEEEAERLTKAIKLYYKYVMEKVYNTRVEQIEIT
jgi:hypothetical protein